MLSTIETDRGVMLKNAVYILKHGQCHVGYYSISYTTGIHKVNVTIQSDKRDDKKRTLQKN